MSLDDDFDPTDLNSYLDPSQVPSRWVGYQQIRGKTYPVKDYLKSLGGRWDSTLRVWWVPDEEAHEARRVARIGPSAIPADWVDQYGPGDQGPAPAAASTAPRCWECGNRVPPRAKGTYSCGCKEPLLLAGDDIPF